jgi:hypothetical protein
LIRPDCLIYYFKKDEEKEVKEEAKEEEEKTVSIICSSMIGVKNRRLSYYFTGSLTQCLLLLVFQTR